MSDRSVLPQGLMTAGGIAIVVGTFLPWVASGTVRRSSYDVFELVERLGHAPDGLFAQALRAWPLVPLLVAVAVVGAWSQRHRVAAVAGVVVSFYSAAVAGAMFAAPSSAGVEVLHGPAVTLVGATVLLTGLVAGLVTGLLVRRIAPVRAGATAPAPRARRGAPLADRS